MTDPNEGPESGPHDGKSFPEVALPEGAGTEQVDDNEKMQVLHDLSQTAYNTDQAKKKGFDVHEMTVLLRTASYCYKKDQIKKCQSYINMAKNALRELRGAAPGRTDPPAQYLYKRVRLPFLFHQGRPVDERIEHAEILSFAFNEGSKDYFRKLVGIESEWRAALNDRSRNMRRLVGCVAGAIALAVLGLLLMIINPPIIANIMPLAGRVLLVAAAIAGLYGATAFYAIGYRRSLARIRDCKSRTEKLVPGEKIDYMSKIHVPFYLVPYTSTTSILFDSVPCGYPERLSIINLSAQDVNRSMAYLKNEVDKLNAVSGDREFLPAERAPAVYSSISPANKLEYPIEQQILNVANLSHPGNWIHDELSFWVSHPESDTARAILNHMPTAVESPEALSITPQFSLMSALECITKIRGIETISQDEAISTAVAGWISSMDSMTAEIESRLMESISEGDAAFQHMRNANSILCAAQLCPACVNVLEGLEKVPLTIKYDLGRFIGNKFDSSIMAMYGGEMCDSCGSHLSAGRQFEHCPACNRRKVVVHPLPGSAQAKAEQMIKAKIKADMREIPMHASLGAHHMDIRGGEWSCPVHGRVATPVEFSAYDEVFSYTADRFWHEMEAPIRRKAEEANVIVTQNRQKLIDQQLALLPFDQDIMALTIERQHLESIGKIADVEITMGGKNEY